MTVVLPSGSGVMCAPKGNARQHRRNVAVKKWLLLLAGAGAIAVAFFLVDKRTVPDYTPPVATTVAPVSVKDTPPAVSDAPAVAPQTTGAAETALEEFAAAVMPADAAPAPSPDTQRIPPSAPLSQDAETIAAGAPKMELPRFHGVDAKQRPFNVTADSASWPDKKHALLEGVRADAALEEGFAEMRADQGRYTLKERVLELEGNVVLRATRPAPQDASAQAASAAGNFAEVRTSGITAELEQQRAYGDHPVTVISDMGTLQADAFGYDAASGVAVFTGGVVLTLETEALQHTSQAITP